MKEKEEVEAIDEIKEVNIKLEEKQIKTVSWKPEALKGNFMPAMIML